MPEELNNAPEQGQQPSAEQDIDLSNIPDNLPTEDVRGLKSAFEKLKAQNAELKRLKEFEGLLEQGLSADQIKSQMETIKRQQELESENEKRIAELKARFETEKEAELREYQNRLAKYQEDIAARDRRESIDSIFAAGGAIATKSNIDAQSRREYIASYLEFNEDNQVVGFKDADGKKLFVSDPNGPKGSVKDATVEDFVFKAQKGDYGPVLQAMFPPRNKAAGSQLPSFSSGDANGYIPLTPQDVQRMGSLSSEELRAIRQRGRLMQ